MIKSIDFYFDFISPYSYLAHKKINILKEQKKLFLIISQFWLGGFTIYKE